MTLDADILVHASPSNIQNLLNCLARWGEGWARELKPEDFIFETGAIRVIEDFALDIFTRMRERSLDDFRPRLRYKEISGVRVAYISPADLVFLKEGSWRDKDQNDVQAMKEIMAREGRSGGQ